MDESGLKFVTQIVDGQIYGAWYRNLAHSAWIEVLGIGMTRLVDCAGQDERAVARQVLEEFVRQRNQQGEPVPSIGYLGEPQPRP